MTTKERPILFSGPMVRAILEGRKTQTRRILKFQPHPKAELRSIVPRPNAVGSCAHFAHVDDRGIHSHSLTLYCPYGMPGDRLWVRETWQRNSGTDGGIVYRADHGRASSVYKADLVTGDWAVAVSGWRPSIFMPRWASRITLEITDVRVERLQEISEADAMAEGISELPLQQGQPGAWWAADPTNPKLHGRSAIHAYANLWQSIHGADSWDANPWVWVVEFKRVEVTP